MPHLKPKSDLGPNRFVVHAIAYSDKEELKGNYIDTSAENFDRTIIFLLFFHSYMSTCQCNDEMG